MRKKYRWHWCSFLFPLAIVVIISIANGVYPFGDRCLLHIDMYHQYCPFFTEFMTKLKSGSSLMYTWNQGLGTDFWALYAYYLASPWNFLLILCPKGHVIEFMTLLTWLKISGCGWTFFLFLREHFELKESKWANLPALVFSTAYALSGFVAAYSWDIMWMDVVMFAPLAIMGVDRILHGRSVWLYYVALALAIWSNYYISIMLCIFLVLYFVAQLTIVQMENFKSRILACVKFAIASLLAGATCAILLIPEAIMLQYAGSSTDTFPRQMEWYFGLLGEIGRGCVTGSVYTGGDHWPNLYVGSFTLLLVLLFVGNRKIARAKRVWGGLGIAFFLISFANNQLDYIWHGFHFPNSLPGRQSYLYIFLLLLLAFAQLRQMRGSSLAQVVGACILWTVLLIAAATQTDEEVTEVYAYVLTILFVLCYGTLVALYRLVPGKWRKKTMLAACLIGACEIIIHFAATGFYTSNRSDYVAKMQDYEELLSLTENSDTSFYRVEDPQRMTKNDNMLYGYSGATVFSSLMNLDVSHLYQSLFMEGGKNYYCYNGATPLTSAMLSVKYMLYDNELEENEFRHLVAKQGNQYLYENTYCLPFGYMMPADAFAQWDPVDMSNKVGNLNSLATALGAQDLLIFNCTQEVKQVVADGQTAISVDEDGYYAAAYFSCDSDRLEMNTSRGRKRVFSKTTHKYLLELGACKAGEEITLSNENEERVEYHIYRINPDAVRQAYDTLALDTMELSRFSDTAVEGTICVTNPGELVLSVPYEAGWSVYVDGEKTEPEAFAHALLAVPLDVGEHQVKLSYETPGLKLSAGISLLGLAGFGIIIGLETRYRKRQNEQRKQ